MTSERRRIDRIITINPSRRTTHLRRGSVTLDGADHRIIEATCPAAIAARSGHEAVDLSLKGGISAHHTSDLRRAKIARIDVNVHPARAIDGRPARRKRTQHRANLLDAFDARKRGRDKLTTRTVRHTRGNSERAVTDDLPRCTGVVIIAFVPANDPGGDDCSDDHFRRNADELDLDSEAAGGKVSEHCQPRFR